VLLLAACAQVPRSGAVVEVREHPQPVTAQDQYNHPRGPQPGDSPAQIVTGFLAAMTATPLETQTAGKFLSAQARGQWRPQRVLTYSNRTVQPRHRQVVVRLTGADEVGASGQWWGPVTAADRRLELPMVREHGDWRIAQVPDALIVPRSFFDQQYQDAEVYFFDPSGRILVPQPVHVPAGPQFASALVRALVRGPNAALSHVVHSYLPPARALSVPVSDSGIADVTLQGPDPGPMSRRTTQLVLDQLSWTLRQDPAITGFRLNIGGHQVTDPASAKATTTFRVGTGSNDPHDPAVGDSVSFFFALRGGLLVSGQIGQPTPVGGPFGDRAQGIGPFAVSLDGDQVAGVTPSELLVGPVSSSAEPAVPVLSGPGLLRPAWDFAGRLWEVRNGPSGATVHYVRHDRAHAIVVPGVTGEDVRRFLVSRDGSRLVAVLHGRHTDRIVVSRMRYDQDDQPRRGTRAHRIPWVASGSSRIVDLGWSTPTTLEVLDQLSGTQAEARILNVDGSTAADEAPTTSIPGRAIGLVISPVGGAQTPYAVQPHNLYDLAQVDTTPASVANIATPGLHHITYTG
jgi:hypothetical protein